MPKLKSNWVLLTSVLVSMFAAYFGWRCFSVDQIRDFVASCGIFGPLAFILLKIASDVIAPISNAVFYLIAEPLFGYRYGLLYLFVGDLIGYSLCFVIGRKYGRPVFVRIAGEQRLAGIQKYFSSVGNVKALILCRLFLFGLQDVVSYAAGLTQISFRRYVLITAVSTFLQTFIGVSLGRSLFNSSPVVFVVFVIAATLVVPACWALWKRRKTKND